ncbi:MAG: endonuclease/exonuclease/phosphatase family protein [Acidobacteriota bacterium]
MIVFVLAVLFMSPTAVPLPEPDSVRVAVFNVWELSREKLDTEDHRQLRAAAEVVQRVRPEVLLINEIDYDAAGENARLFVKRFLREPQNGQSPIDYPHVYVAPVNTGLPSGLDLNRDGESDGPDDAWGFGRYPGQYGMALLSQVPIDTQRVRTFQKLRWVSMPGHHMPDGRDGRPAWYEPAIADQLRLSSKSHWDVPILLGSGNVLHVIAAHPTPPVFDDGQQDRNGRRNFDEIRLIADYVAGGERAAWIIDDHGEKGGLSADQSFVILGDLNADPGNDVIYDETVAIDQLLDHPRVRDTKPVGAGGAYARRGSFFSDDRLYTANYGRLDYALPSKDLTITGSGIFWPGPGEPLRHLVDGDDKASDHMLVWVDIDR